MKAWVLQAFRNPAEEAKPAGPSVLRAGVGAAHLSLSSPSS